MKNKKCSKCKKAKPVSEFNKRKRNKDGYRFWCRKCDSIAAHAWQKENRDRVNTNARRRMRENPDISRKKNLKKFFGITLEEYDKMWGDQNGLCAVCGRPETAVLNGVVKRLAVDHNHKTKKVRALLCNKCNCALGYASDSITRLMKLINYLERHN